MNASRQDADILSSLPRPAAGFRWRSGPAGRVLECDSVAAIARHLFTTHDIALTGGTADAGWRQVAEALGAEEVWRLRQVHGCDLHPAEGTRGVAPTGDGLFSERRGPAVAVQTADCVPLLIADRRSGRVAAVHAGWRGTLQGIGCRTVDRLARTGSRAGDLVAAIGPSIGPCCYEVGEEVEHAFAERWRTASAGWFTRLPALRLDMWRANRDQLAAAGLRVEDVHVSALCTRCHAGVFPSYRRDGAGAGRMLGAIAPPKA